MRLIDTETVAFILKCTQRNVQKIVAAGTLRNYGETWAVKVDLDELTTAIEEGRVKVRDAA